MTAPGLFVHLVKSGAVSPAALAPLVAILPDESYFMTGARGGEALRLRSGQAFESRRRPCALDAALARFAARRMPDPDGRIAALCEALDAAAGDLDALAAIYRAVRVTYCAAIGDDGRVLAYLVKAPTDAERAALAGPAPPRAQAHLEMQLAGAWHDAAAGLFAYHVHRGLPGLSATCAAHVVGDALAAGAITVDALIAEAIRLRGRA